MAEKNQDLVKEFTMAELGAHIKNFEFDGNYVKLYFDTGLVADDSVIQKKLASIGITEIIHKHTDMTGAKAVGHIFILDYQYSKQKKAISALHDKFMRMAALNNLLAYGGFELTKDEQEYFAAQAARMAAVKMAGKVK